MKEFHDLCVMCKHYLSKCTLEEIQMRHSETWDGFKARIPGAVRMLDGFRRRLLAGDVGLEELAIRKRISRGGYRGNSPQGVVVAAMKRSGVEVHPGEHIDYIIRDSLAERPSHRYVPLQYPLDGRYDADKYTELLARSLAGMFLPFGYTLERIMDGLADGVQTTLGD